MSQQHQFSEQCAVVKVNTCTLVVVNKSVRARIRCRKELGRKDDFERKDDGGCDEIAECSFVFTT